MPCVYMTPAGLCDGKQSLSKNGDRWQFPNHFGNAPDYLNNSWIPKVTAKPELSFTVTRTLVARA
jgi:hypothetical protein